MMVIVVFNPNKVVHFLSPFGVPTPNPWMFVGDIVNWDRVFFGLLGILTEFFEKLVS